MKKFMILTLTLVMALLSSVLVFAGDIPESLLFTEDAKVFLATVENYTTKEASVSPYVYIDTVELIPTEKIKGDVEIGVKESYSRCETTITPEPDVEYLVGYVDEINLYIYEIESRKDGKFKLVNSDKFDMTKRLETYLNDGSFEKAEKERVAKIEEADTSSTSVIGGADAPTNIVVKSNTNVWGMVGIGTALIILVAGVILVIKKKSK